MLTAPTNYVYLRADPPNTAEQAPPQHPGKPCWPRCRPSTVWCCTADQAAWSQITFSSSGPLCCPMRRFRLSKQLACVTGSQIRRTDCSSTRTADWPIHLAAFGRGPYCRLIQHHRTHGWRFHTAQNKRMVDIRCSQARHCRGSISRTEVVCHSTLDGPLPLIFERGHHIAMLGEWVHPPQMRLDGSCANVLVT